jgi:hypothetical protein
MKFPRFHESQSSGKRADTCGWTGGHDKGNGRFSRLYASTQKLFISLTESIYEYRLILYTNSEYVSPYHTNRMVIVIETGQI